MFIVDTDANISVLNDPHSAMSPLAGRGVMSFETFMKQPTTPTASPHRSFMQDVCFLWQNYQNHTACWEQIF